MKLGFLPTGHVRSKNEFLPQHVLAPDLKKLSAV